MPWSPINKQDLATFMKNGWSYRSGGGSGGGSGSSVHPDWNQNDPEAVNYVKGRTHYDGHTEISWDITNTENYLEVISGYSNRKWYKVSNYTPSEEELLKNGVYRQTAISQATSGVEYARTDAGYAVVGRITSSYPNQEIVVAIKAGYKPRNENVVFPEPGIYVRMNRADGRTLSWGETVPLDEKYIPDTIARTADVPTDDHINSIVDTKLGVIENGTY